MGVKVVNLDTSSRTLKIEYNSLDTAHTTNIRNARIVAIRKEDLELSYAASDSDLSPTTTMADYVTRNWTPSSSGDYLLHQLRRVEGRLWRRVAVEAHPNANPMDSGILRTRYPSNFACWTSFVVASCDTSQQTTKIRASEDAGDGRISRARAVALRLAGSPLSDYESGKRKP